MASKKLLPFFTPSLLIIFVFLEVTITEGQVARKFPLCISEGDAYLNNAGPVYKEFLPIIKNVQTYFNPTKIRTIGPGDPPSDESSHKFIDWIRISRIGVDFNKLVNKEKVLSTQILGNGNQFNQWVHIAIKAKKNIQGLIVQAMHGPVGIPFGHFGEFPGKEGARCKCVNDMHNALNYVAIPCTYKPLAGLRHPDIYTFHYNYERPHQPDSSQKDIGTEITTEIHLNFNFVDVVCERASSIQFLVLIVTDFGANEAEAALTHVFQRPKPTSTDGIPYPFHPDLCEALTCGETAVKMGTTAVDNAHSDTHFMTPAPGSNDTGLAFNAEYDECVQKGPIRPGATGCPPGPFKCNTTKPKQLGTEDELEKEAKFSKKAQETFAAKDCPCRIFDMAESLSPDKTLPKAKKVTSTPWLPTGIDLNDITESQRTEESFRRTTPNPFDPLNPVLFDYLSGDLKNATEDLSRLAELNRRARAVHGIVMFFAFFIMCSISIFLARFDKDTLPGVGCCAKGMWLWGHIYTLHIVLTASWGGLAILLLTESSTWSGAALHGIFGYITMFLFHIDFIFGWIRPIGRKCRNIYIMVHALVGYGTKIFAGITMIMTQNYLIPLIFILLIEGVTILFCICGGVIQCLTDTQMKIKTKRKVFPVLEYKELERPISKSFSGCARCIVLALYTTIMILIFFLCIIYWPPQTILRSYFDLISPGNFNGTSPRPTPGVGRPGLGGTRDDGDGIQRPDF